MKYFFILLSFFQDAWKDDPVEDIDTLRSEVVALKAVGECMGTFLEYDVRKYIQAIFTFLIFNVRMISFILYSTHQKKKIRTFNSLWTYFQHCLMMNS